MSVTRQETLAQVIRERDGQAAVWGPKDARSERWASRKLAQASDGLFRSIHSQFGKRGEEETEHLRKRAVKVAALAVGLAELLGSDFG